MQDAACCSYIYIYIYIGKGKKKGEILNYEPSCTENMMKWSKYLFLSFDEFDTHFDIEGTTLCQSVSEDQTSSKEKKHREKIDKTRIPSSAKAFQEEMKIWLEQQRPGRKLKCCLYC
ncbi:hypothetical protein AABB24_025461 [Solanum stoloniferum]|uniref:Uncharacterized protein n=1 Tax=Solanum stoloniferum TaxID=62892 RepID=A0ABD2ST94_9SOLN